MTNFEQYGYELLEKKEMKDIQAMGYHLTHKKSGAHLLLLENDDENKVFNIAFRTPPEDSTGLPHILEHSVLCGSRKYPLKDPFVELVKGSLNTFLNAMTYPDKTMYPVASCNDQDFQNLMNVYMDAVFYTNIYKKEEIFRQEGWSYNLESKDDQLTYNGVVYNEMKGAFSSPDQVLEREILNSLFPDTSYANESGGDPQYIPDLTYEQFLDFHSKYYHPANSYIFLYGNMEMEEKLQWLDQEYLSGYDAIEIDSEIHLQKPFAQFKEVKKKFSIAEGEPEEDNTYLSYNVAVGTSLEKELCMAFQILEYALLSAPGAPLKQALLDAGIGKDISGSYDDGLYQPIFSIIAKNANLSQKEAFIDTIQGMLKDIAEKGIDKSALLAGINYFEFRFREADYGRFPKGLMYCIDSFNSWLYDKNQPFLHLEQLELFDELKEKAESDYFEQLIRNYLIGNTHGTIVIVEPEKGLTARIDAQTQKKLDDYKASLSEEQLEDLVRKTRELREYQEESSSREEMECIPMLKRTDIKRQTAPVYNKELEENGVKILHHDLNTSEIGYITLLFDVSQIEQEFIPYLGILKNVLGFMDTEHYKYGDLFNEINRYTGGIHSTFNIYGNVKDTDNYKMMFEVKAKTLYGKLDFTFEMIKEILFHWNFRDEKRLYEIIAQMKSRLQMQLNSSGHLTAANRVLSYFSSTAYLTDLTSGIAFYKEIEKIENHFEGEKAGLIEKLTQLCEKIFCRENLMISFTGDESGLEILKKEIKGFVPELHSWKPSAEKLQLPLEKKNEGFMTSSKIQYVARAGNFGRKGFAYTGALKILKVILSYDYLWNNVRVKGGAYGCMSGFNKLGDSYFVSYRDPNLEKTNEVYEGVSEYLRSVEIDERDMTKYVIGTISDLDTPLNPAGKGNRSLGIYLTGQTVEELQQERDEILEANIEDIRKLADMMDAILEQKYFCVIGNEEKIKEQKELFQQILPLIEQD